MIGLSDHTGVRLGVNVDHVATLRQVRLARYPDIIEALHLCERGGADQITVHLREDRRHIQDEDVRRLLEASLLPLNLEMAMTREMFSLAKKFQPYSITLVPERRAEMTTESGLDLSKIRKFKKWIATLKTKMRVYGFIDPDARQVRAAVELGLDGVEFHTGTFAEAFDDSLRSRGKKLDFEVTRLQEASALAHELSLEVKAGHGLTIQNVPLLRVIPEITEMNIGHSIVARSIVLGLEGAVREMKDVLGA